MRKLLLLLALTLPASAQDLYLSCAIHPLQHSKAILGKQAGASDRLWTCGITNSGAVERVVTEADVIVTMQGLGVRAVQAAAVREVFARKMYTGRLRTTARILGHISDFAVVGVALDVIKMSPAWRSFVGLAGTMIPVIGPALAERTPDGTGLQILHVTEPLGIKPGAGVKLAMWSGPHDGPLIVRGYMDDYISPQSAPAQIAPGLTRTSSHELGQPSRGQHLCKADMDGRSVVTEPSAGAAPFIWQPAVMPPRWLSSRTRRVSPPLCAHVLRADCGGRCEGWWR